MIVLLIIFLPLIGVISKNLYRHHKEECSIKRTVSVFMYEKRVKKEYLVEKCSPRSEFARISNISFVQLSHKSEASRASCSLIVSLLVPPPRKLVPTLFRRWPYELLWRSGGGGASDEKSGGMGRQLATPAVSCGDDMIINVIPQYLSIPYRLLHRHNITSTTSCRCPKHLTEFPLR